jgi:hypothetical protein
MTTLRRRMTTLRLQMKNTGWGFRVVCREMPL